MPPSSVPHSSASRDGRLFVAEPNRPILAFAPGATGNVAPSQVIEDFTPIYPPREGSRSEPINDEQSAGSTQTAVPRSTADMDS
jgi:hypothetical protein